MSTPAEQDLFADPSTAAAEARRARIVAAISPGYNGALHFTALMTLALAAMGWALSRIHAVHAWELLIVPASFVFANGVEWLVHKGPLHHPMPPRILYERHTLTHHAAFTDNSMAIRSWREMRIVLFPLPALPAFALIVIPIASVLGMLLSPNAASLFYATSLGYYLLYEICHVSYHLPDAHPVARNRFVARLRAHHQRHHDPRLMTRGNFNVTLPLFDRLMGTHL